MQVSAYAARSANEPLAPMMIDRRDVGPSDVLIDIEFAGICHSDIHQARGEWGNSVFPMVPGHEIVGRVTRVGANVKKFKVGDRAGVGCVVDSCAECEPCYAHHEQFCTRGCAFTYNSTEMDRKTPTHGGYSKQIVTREQFVMRVPHSLDPSGAAPLLCAGITTYSPLRQWNVKKNDRVGVVGLGGLGHMAVKLASAMGAEVTMLSTSKNKAPDAKKLGAHSFALTTDKSAFTKLSSHFDVIIDTISADHDINAYLGLVKPYGALALVGVPPKSLSVHAFSLINGNKRLAGSNIGGMKETQEMLDFCAEHGIVSDVEVIGASKINEAYERVLKSDVRYRFSIDASTF